MQKQKKGSQKLKIWKLVILLNMKVKKQKSFVRSLSKYSVLS